MTKLNKNERFFFTFGTDPEYPFERGWVEIDAPTIQIAETLFRTDYPDRSDNILNCAFVYGEDFTDTDVYKGKYPGEFCHRKIVVNIEDENTEEA